MQKLLDEFFNSNKFWKQFNIVRERSNIKMTFIDYQFKVKYHKIELKFFELDGVKCVSIIVNREILVKSIFFINLDELILILNRIPQIRLVNPLCDGSQSIRALSCSQKIENSVCPA